MNNVRTMMASDSAMLCNMVKDLLLPFSELSIIGATDVSPRISEAVLRERPHILILDAAVKTDGLMHVLDELRAALPELKMILITQISQDEEVSIAGAFTHGIRGFVCRTEVAEGLAAAIQVVAAGDVYLCPIASNVLLRSYRRRLEDISPCVSTGEL